MSRFLPLAFLLLAGCAGDQANRQDLGAIAAARLALAEPLPAENRPPVIVEKPVPDPRIEAVQQSLTGLGLQFNKVADEASLAKVSANATASAVADLKVQLHAVATAVATLNATANVDVDAQAKLFESLDLLRGAIAKLELKLDAQNAAMVGMQNNLNQVKDEVRAGRDAYVTQFTLEMERVLTKAFDANVKAVSVAAGVLTALISAAAYIVVRSKEQSRARAKEEADENWKIAERASEDYRAFVGLILNREKERDEHEARMRETKRLPVKGAAV